jgi:hypothetical protein
MIYFPLFPVFVEKGKDDQKTGGRESEKEGERRREEEREREE